MSSTRSTRKSTGVIVAVIMLGLILAGIVTLLVLRSLTDMTSFYIAVAAIILAPIFVFAVYMINKKSQ